MPARAVVVIAILFAVTVATGAAGYAVYYSYAGVLSKLSEGSPGLYALLTSFERLEYTASSPGDGDFRIVVENDPGAGRLTITVYDANGTKIETYKVEYGPDGVVSAERVDELTGESKIVPPSEMERILLSPLEFETAQAQEAGFPEVTGVKPSPGLGPLVLPYTIAEELGVDWRTATSPWAEVNVGFTTAQLGGEEVKGVAVTVRPNTRLPTSPWTQITIASLLLAEVEGIPAAVQASVVVGQDRLDLTLTLLTPAR